jgi:hypothetical protein
MTLTTIDPAALYICDEPFASPNGACRRDDKLRGDHILVSSYPTFFSPADALDSERGSVWKSLSDEHAAKEEVRKAAEAAERERQARANRVRLEAAQVMVATADIVHEHDGHPALIAKGSTVHEDNPIVAAFPDLFTPTSKR